MSEKVALQTVALQTGAAVQAGPRTGSTNLILVPTLALLGQNQSRHRSEVRIETQQRQAMLARQGGDP